MNFSDEESEFSAKESLKKPLPKKKVNPINKYLGQKFNN